MDEKEKLIYFYYERSQAVRRAQKHYFALLLTFLGFVWVFYWNKPAASAANFFGMPLSDKSLLGITPGVHPLAARLRRFFARRPVGPRANEGDVEQHRRDDEAGARSN